jgi:hypothetical protein
MKTSNVILNLARAAFVVMAYKEMAQPKAGLIPPGISRSVGHYIKSCYQIGRGYLKTLAGSRKMKDISADGEASA